MYSIFNILKRPFCKHCFETVTFQYRFPGMKERETFPCKGIDGTTLQQCRKCGKTRVIIEEE